MKLELEGKLKNAVGFVILAIGLLANEFLLALAFSSDGVLSADSLLAVRSFNFLCILAGLTLIFRNKITAKSIFSTLIIGLISLSMLEATIALALHIPALQKANILTSVLRPIYWKQLTVIQFNPSCAEFDEFLSYTLKPGSCHFSSPEFETHYNINSAGFRDDEGSLNGPEIIVVGDSMAMGWGVEQDETFSQILEMTTGKLVLNAGISSYATPRELDAAMLVDNRNLKTIIIQYSDNDYNENLSFFINKNTRSPLQPTEYECLKDYANRNFYFPLKYSLIALTELFPFLSKYSGPGAEETCLAGSLNIGRASSAGELSDSFLFLNSLSGIDADLSDVQVIVIETSAFMNNTSLIRDLSDADIPTGIGSFTAVEVRSFLDKSDFLQLDGHLSQSGHRKIADYLAILVANDANDR